MLIGENAKYGLVLASSIIGAIAGHVYTNKATNLRVWLERKGTRLLRPSDPSWMYERMVKRNREGIKKVLNERKNTGSSSSTTSTQTDEELALELMHWCQDSLAERKWNLTKQVTDYCAHPF